jgi:hypothetical protein
MIKPDIRTILTAKMLMLGFTNPVLLATKLYSSLQIFSENLYPLHSKQSDYLKLNHHLKLTLRSTKIFFHRLKFVMRTFNYKQHVTEDYIVANALRGAYMSILSP